MRLREFSDEDKTLYKLKYLKDLIAVFNELSAQYNSLIKESNSLSKHKTLIADYVSRVDSLLDEIKLLHDYCLESEDDAETRHVATTLKTMFNTLSGIIDIL